MRNCSMYETLNLLKLGLAVRYSRFFHSYLSNRGWYTPRVPIRVQTAVELSLVCGRLEFALRMLNYENWSIHSCPSPCCLWNRKRTNDHFLRVRATPHLTRSILSTTDSGIEKALLAGEKSHCESKWEEKVKLKP